MELLCTTKGNQLRVRIIEASVKDDSDYDHIYDAAVQNTLKPYFEWAETAKGTVSFEKNWDHDFAFPKMLIDAVFEEKEDYALFKLTYGHKPFSSLKLDNMFDGRFV